MPPIYLLVTPEIAAMDTTKRLADELRGYTNAGVAIRPDVRESDTDDAFLLLVSSEPAEWMLSLPNSDRQSTLGRAVPLLCRRPPGMLKLLEEHALAGGVDSLRYGMWQDHPSKEGGYGIAGRRDVVERLGGECAPSPFTSAHYCIYESPTSKNLPQALVEYLNALAELRADVGRPDG
jgi:hypothetical protein